MAVVDSRLEDVVEARKHLERAAALYKEDGRDWCARYRRRALALIDAIESGSHPAMVTGWRRETMSALGLEPLEIRDADT